MNDQPKLEVVKHKAFPVDPVAAGRKGVRAREAKVMDHLTETRQYVNTLAMPAAQYVGSVLDEDSKPDRIRLDAARDILDRTIGKAPTELRIGPSEENLAIIRDLDSSDETQQ